MTKKRRSVSGLPFIAALLIAGSIPALIGITGFTEAVLATFYSRTAKGVIDHFECPRRSSNCDVVVKYVHPDGSSRTVVEGNASPSPDFVTGSSVQVFIANKGPREVIRIDRFFYLWFMPMLLSFISLPFLSAAAYLIWHEIKPQPLRTRNRRTPVKPT